MKDDVRDDHHVLAEREESVHARLAVPVVPEVAVDGEEAGNDVAAGTIEPDLLAVPQSLLPQYEEHVDERGQDEHGEEFGVNGCNSRGKRSVLVSDILRREIEFQRRKFAKKGLRKFSMDDMNERPISELISRTLKRSASELLCQNV